MSYEAFSDAVYLAFNDETTGKATVSSGKYCIKARLKIILSIIFEKGVLNLHYNLECFLKPFLKGKILRSSERGVNSILTTILRF